MSVGNPKSFLKIDNFEAELKGEDALEKEADVSRVYKHKNSRIKKELKILTKKNGSQLT